MFVLGTAIRFHGATALWPSFSLFCKCKLTAGDLFWLHRETRCASRPEVAQHLAGLWRIGTNAVRIGNLPAIDPDAMHAGGRRGQP